MAEPEKAALHRAGQLAFPGMSPVEEALERFADAGIEERGAVYTRREVVEFILDLVGYTAERPLHEHALLEPSFGQGDFLLIAAERLIAAWREHAPNLPATDLAPCIRAVELHRRSYTATRAKLIGQLEKDGIESGTAACLADAWIIHGDFLLTPFSVPGFRYIVGNPPYVRQELIPDALLSEYRTLYRTIFDRADIYIPFIERSLTLLAEGGSLGLICADRWMKNRYGGPLRRLVADQYHLKCYIDMVDTAAFHSEVIAYPAITVITREKPGPTRIARRPEISRPALAALARDLSDSGRPDPHGQVKEVARVADGAQPWILESSDQLALVRRLEHAFPCIEDAGCRVGIGVATGADKAFIAPFDELDVEDDRKLPLAMTRDILSGQVNWQGLGIVNPFADHGGLADLAQYPRLRRYLESRRDLIANRHVARKAPARWYRTIDRIYPALAARPKLLIPDIKGEAHVVYEDGWLYPHHNLYYITSDRWDLRALQAVLMSGIARLFVATYSTRMRGGYLRFQAQYLRRIRLPHWEAVSKETMNALIDAAHAGDVEACNEAVFRLYVLDAAERAALGGNGAG